MKKIFILAMAVILTFSLNSVFAAKGDNQGVQEEQDTCKTIMSGELLNSTGKVITTGYNEWGYNYQARIFNGYYCDAYQDAAWCQDYKTTKLSMKWNNAWISNQSCDGDALLDRHYGYDSYIGSGAWLTNHMSDEYEEFVGWDISGDWVIAVNNGAYLHDYSFTMTSLEDGTFTGLGGYPAGASDYTFDEVVVNGEVDGSLITFTAQYYQNGLPTGYTWTANGTIDETGKMSGTGTSGVSNWQSTSGVATKSYKTCSWDYFTKIVAVPSDAIFTDGYWFTVDGEEIGYEIWGDFAVVLETEENTCKDPYFYKGFRPGVGNWENPPTL